MNAGYVKLHRKITDWEWYKDAVVSRVFVHLVLTANHKPGKWRGISVERGQVISGRKSLASELNISEQNVRFALQSLISTNEIRVQTTNKYSIITICNYASYQFSPNQSNQQTTSQPTNKQPTNNHKQEEEEVVVCDGGDRPVEFPKGFPKTEKEAAAHAGFVGCTEEFAAKVWNTAAGRCGTDSRGNPIGMWRHYLKAQHAYEQEKQAKEKHDNSNRGNYTPEKRITRNLGGNAEADPHDYDDLVLKAD